MLSEGNHLFQASITITDDGLKMKIPNFWKDKETFFRYEDISGFRVDTPSWYNVLSYCTIHLNARGTWVEAHGFTKSDAQKIENYIEVGQKGSSSNRSSRTSGREYHEEWMKNSRRRNERYFEALRQLGEEEDAKNRKLVEKIKHLLTGYLQLFYLYNYDGDEKEADKMQPKIKEQKKYLLKYLRNIGEENQFESILEECRNSARAEYDRRIAEINEKRESEWRKYFGQLFSEDELMKRFKELGLGQKRQTAKDNEFETLGDFDSDDSDDIEYFKGIGEDPKTPKQDFDFPTLFAPMPESEEKGNNLIKKLTKDYDDLNVEVLEDCDRVNENSLIVETLINNIIKGEQGRKFLIKEIQFTEFEDLIHAQLVIQLFYIINEIYNSTAYQKTVAGKKVFPFGLDNPKVIDYLKNKDNSLCDRISKLIDVTDSFVDRIAKSIE